MSPDANQPGLGKQIGGPVSVCPARSAAAVADERADALVGKDLQQGCMRNAPVNDMRAGYATLHGIQSALDFGEHAAVYDAVLMRSCTSAVWRPVRISPQRLTSPAHWSAT